MANELQVFVKEALEKGQNRSSIEQALQQAGWEQEEIKKAMEGFADVQFPVAVPKPKPYLQAREAFLYLVSFIALYISAFSFGVLVFAFIEKFFPDPVSYGVFSPRGITTALASIIIAFPLYLFMTRLLNKAAEKDPERRQSKVGKWLTYITLVIAAGIIIGDLIAVLAGLLGGELTGRFVLKALTVLAIAGSIFGYYLWSLQREEREKEALRQAQGKKRPMAVKVFAGVVIAIVVAAVVYGLTLVGTPAQQRLLQFDERRVQDLQQISYAVDSYWQRNDQLPQNLEDLRAPTYYVGSIVDPKTGEPYEYNVHSESSYEVCATFETDSSGQEGPSIAKPPFHQGVWEHGIGRTCFELEVAVQVDNTRPIPVE